MAKQGDDRLDRLRAKRQGRQPSGAANWGDANPAAVVNAIAWTAANGGALRFGYTRDGGAYAIGIYMSDQANTEYVRPNEDIDRYLSDLAEDMEFLYRQEAKPKKD